MKTEEIKNLLLKLKEKNKIQNAYIVYGGNIKLRNEVAIFLSGILNCIEGIFCEKCDNCKRIKNDTHPDIKWIIPEKYILSIDEVRDVKKEIFIKPYLGKYKIYIFQIEHLKEEAASAFLKVIEEPPEFGIIIILCPNINFLLPTITSRCFKIYINYELPELNEEGIRDINEFLELLNKVINKNFLNFFKLVDIINKRDDREKIEKWFENVLIFMRDSFLFYKNFPLEFFISKNSKLFENFLYIEPNLIEKFWEIKQRVKYNINLKLAIENLIFQTYFSLKKDSRSGGNEPL
ncbi:MAG: hypothetical protein ACK4F0_07405 [Candidatus Ratteibacteria bacterium]